MRTFTSSTGITIIIGENATENDTLVKSSHQDFVWCHLKNLPSAHAVIQSTEPDPTTLTETFQLIKFYSKQREARQVAVIFTKIREVERIDKRRPGLVELRSAPKEKTIRNDVRALRFLGINPNEEAPNEE